MQGTIVMMMALSGLGCHHKKCCVDYVAPCYTVSYPAPSHQGCYGGGGYGGCYGGSMAYVAPACYCNGLRWMLWRRDCYGGGCYGCGGATAAVCYGAVAASCCPPRQEAGFSCFGHRRRACDVFAGDLAYAMPVYGSYSPVYPAVRAQRAGGDPASAGDLGSGDVRCRTRTLRPATAAGRPVRAARRLDGSRDPRPTTPPAPSTPPPSPSPGSPPTAS